MFPEYEYRNAALVITGGSCRTPYPMRFHKHVEIVYVRSGFLDVTIDGKPYSLRSGDLYIVFPNLLHDVRQADAIKHQIIVSPELFTALCDTLSRCKPVCPVLRTKECDPYIGMLCDHLLELAKSDFRRNYPALTAHANALLSEILLHTELEERKSDSELVQRLVLYLLENYTEEISLEQMSASLGYSKYHISHVIADTFSCNFRTLLNSYRISMAQNLMLSTGQSISQVAFACGFRNQSSFNRIFLKQCGMTPSEFRQQAVPTPAEPQLFLK